jgi:hypothetical protein
MIKSIRIIFLKLSFYTGQANAVAAVHIKKYLKALLKVVFTIPNLIFTHY